MFYNLPDITKTDVKGKIVFLRADLDVPLSEDRRHPPAGPLREASEAGKTEDRKIEDDTRLKAGLPTIQYLLNNGAKVIIAGHLDRPKGRDERFSLEPVADWLQKNVKCQMSNVKCQIDGLDGWELSVNLFLLENLRFYPGEEQNDSEFSQKLAALAQVYANDAFAMSHRKHASIVGVAKFLPHFAGFHLQKEVEVLSSVLQDPKRPLVVVIGGKKIETKLPLVLKMYNLADYVLVGGKIAQEKEALHAACKRTSHKCLALMIADLNKDGSDITGEDIQKFLRIISKAKTVIWNGPMGIISSKFSPRGEAGKVQSSKLEKEDTEWGTREIAQAIVKSDAYKVVGGGDTTEFLKRIGLLAKFDFVSTGGGAMLAFLSGEKLPGLEALIKPA